MEIADILRHDVINEAGVPCVAIINYGSHTMLFVDGKQVGEGCSYVKYEHDLRTRSDWHSLPKFETDHKDNPVPAKHKDGASAKF